MKLKLIDRLIFAELIGPFLFGVMAFTSVMFAGSYLLKITNWLMSGQIGVGIAAQMVLLVVPSIVVFTLPMSTLLSVLLGIGRLSGDSEIVALFAGGISLYRIAIPVVILGFVVSLASVTLNEVVVPRAHDRYEAIQAVIFKQAAPSQKGFAVDDDERNLHIVVKGGIDADKGILKNVLITQFAKADGNVNGVSVQKDQPLMVIYAARATWEGLGDDSKQYKWKLYDGFWQIVGTDSPAMSTFQRSQTREIEMNKNPSQFALYQKANMNNTDQLSFSELSQIVAYLKVHPDRPLDDIRELDVNRWNKLALPLSSLVFALLAAPLGVRPSRTASSVGFGLSILLILIYWITWHFTSHLAIQGNLPPAVGAFTADTLGVIASIVLIRRASQ